MSVWLNAVDRQCLSAVRGGVGVVLNCADRGAGATMWCRQVSGLLRVDCNVCGFLVGP